MVFCELGLGGGEFFPEVEGLLEFAVLAEDVAGVFGVVVEVGVGDGFFEFAEAVLAFCDELGVVHGRWRAGVLAGGDEL